MGFEINTYNKRVFNQLTNGLTFNKNLDAFDETFTGNVEKLRVQVEYEYTWFSSSDPLSWNIQAGSIESIGQNFQADGWEIGQEFEFYSDWALRLTGVAEFVGQIDTIQNGGSLITFTILSGVQTTIGASETNVGIWADATNENNLMPSLFVKFGMPLVTESDSFESKLDNSLQKYYIENLLSTGEQNLDFATPTVGQYTGQMTAEVVASVEKNTKRIRIKHDLLVNPPWISTDTPDVLINPPSGDVKNILSVDNPRFAGIECLRYVQEIELRQTFTNLVGRKQRIAFDGNTGWFQDNFNSGSKQFELHDGSVIFNGGASTGLNFGASNSIQFDIKASNGGDIPPNSPFGVYFQVLPPESRYQNQTTEYKTNFAYDAAVNDEGAIASGGENGYFSNVVGVLTNIAGVDMIRVNCDLDLTGSTAQFDDNFIIWAGCESPNADISDVKCNERAKSGGAGVTDLNISLKSTGGVIIFDLQAYSQKDKFEFIHNGIKVRTSSMLSVNNGGVFDPFNDASSYDDNQWYIGGAGTPDFYADFVADTGITTLPIVSGYNQRIWWQYTPADYAAAPSVVFRATGVGGTKWDVIRVCEG